MNFVCIFTEFTENIECKKSDKHWNMSCCSCCFCGCYLVRCVNLSSLMTFSIYNDVLLWQQLNSGTQIYKNKIVFSQTYRHAQTNKQSAHTHIQEHIRARTISCTHIDCRKSIKIKVIWTYMMCVCVCLYDIYIGVYHISLKVYVSIERERNNSTNNDEKNCHFDYSCFCRSKMYTQCMRKTVDCCSKVVNWFFIQGRHVYVLYVCACLYVRAHSHYISSVVLFFQHAAKHTDAMKYTTRKTNHRWIHDTQNVTKCLNRIYIYRIANGIIIMLHSRSLRFDVYVLWFFACCDAVCNNVMENTHCE